MTEVRDAMEAYVGRVASRLTRNNLIFRMRRENRPMGSVLIVEGHDKANNRCAFKEMDAMTLITHPDPLKAAEEHAQKILDTLGIKEVKLNKSRGPGRQKPDPDAPAPYNPKRKKVK